MPGNDLSLIGLEAPRTFDGILLRVSSATVSELVYFIEKSNLVSLYAESCEPLCREKIEGKNGSQIHVWVTF